MDNDLSREVGRLEGKVEQLTTSIEDLKDAVIRLATEVKSNKEMLDNAKGGLKFAVWLIGAAGLIGALLNQLGSMLFNAVK